MGYATLRLFVYEFSFGIVLAFELGFEFAVVLDFDVRVLSRLLAFEFAVEGAVVFDVLVFCVLDVVGYVAAVCFQVRVRLVWHLNWVWCGSRGRFPRARPFAFDVVCGRVFLK